MSREQHADRGRAADREPLDPERDQFAAQEHEKEPGPPPLGGDFAEEHSEVTFADQEAGGPEGEEEPEAPSGYAGMESRGVAKRRREDDG